LALDALASHGGAHSLIMIMSPRDAGVCAARAPEVCVVRVACIRVRYVCGVGVTERFAAVRLCMCVAGAAAVVPRRIVIFTHEIPTREHNSNSPRDEIDLHYTVTVAPPLPPPTLY